MLDNDAMDALVSRILAPGAPLQLVRACTLGDGIEAGSRAEPPGTHPLRFVPASGAATRMFQAFHQVASVDLAGLSQACQNTPSLTPALRAFEAWTQLAMSRALPHADPAQDLPGTVRAMHEGGFSARPKGLVPFHLEGETGWRSAIDDHLREAALAGADARAHLTAPTDHLQAFEALVQDAVERVEADLGVRVEVGLSIQHPRTDTPAIDTDGNVIRRPDGSPWLRPGGHGALLRNLDALSGLIRIINVDNIAHADHRAALRPWGDRLVATALELRDARDAWTARVRRGEDLDGARAFLADFGHTGPVRADALLRDLDRPIRVCAVVPNDGQPGGGPFWVRTADGRVTAQIVEGVEVDHADPEQAAIWASSTHFNPVDMVCWLDDSDGQPFDLTRFVDDDRWIRTRKHHGGVQARCLERPGLWNGSMSGWLTRFVALPRESFNPVKTLADLLDPRHLPATSSGP